MAEGILAMSVKERDRLLVLRQVECKGLLLKEAAERLGVSYRQAKRLWAAYGRRGATGLVHGLRGQHSNRRVDEGVVSEALRLYREHYWDFGPTLAAEKLAEVHGIDINRETLRRRLHEAHLLVTGRLSRVHRRARTRRSQFGALVQMDGSHHAWFEDRAPKCCLMVMVDDATGRAEAFFSREETTQGAFALLRRWVERWGVPQSLYMDRKSVYRPEREPNAQERAQGSLAQSDFGRACFRLGIQTIFARSPQAKGRVERMNGTLQNRLVKELRLRGISDMDTANAFLPQFLDSLNAKFAVEPASAVNGHRLRPGAEDLNEVFCHEKQRALRQDYTFRCGSLHVQITRQKPLPRPGTRLTVRFCHDGTLKILHGEMPLEFRLIGHQTNQVVPSLPPGGGKEQLPSIRGHFYCAEKGDTSIVL